jgi:hypothetical protein
MFLQVTIIVSGRCLSCLHCWRVCRRMTSDANGGTANFHVVPPPQRLGYMDPYDLYDMDEADEEEQRR